MTSEQSNAVASALDKMVTAYSQAASSFKAVNASGIERQLMSDIVRECERQASAMNTYAEQLK